MDKNTKLKLLLTIGCLLILSIVYATWSIIDYNRSEEQAREQKIRDSISYLKKADVEELLAKPTTDAEYIWEVYISDGGYAQWHTQKLFLLRHKPVYTMLTDHYVRFKIFMGDSKRAEEKQDATFAKDLVEVRKNKAIAPLEYRMYNKEGKMVMHIRGQIPHHDGIPIIRMALAPDAVEKCQYVDYVKIREAHLAKAREAAEKRARERAGLHTPKTREELIKAKHQRSIKRPQAKPVTKKPQAPMPQQRKSTLTGASIAPKMQAPQQEKSKQTPRKSTLF